MVQLSEWLHLQTSYWNKLKVVLKEVSYNNSNLGIDWWTFWSYFKIFSATFFPLFLRNPLKRTKLSCNEYWAGFPAPRSQQTSSDFFMVFTVETSNPCILKMFKGLLTRLLFVVMQVVESCGWTSVGSTLSVWETRRRKTAGGGFNGALGRYASYSML